MVAICSSTDRMTCPSVARGDALKATEPTDARPPRIWFMWLGPAIRGSRKQRLRKKMVAETICLRIGHIWVKHSKYE